MTEKRRFSQCSEPSKRQAAVPSWSSCRAGGWGLGAGVLGGRHKADPGEASAGGRGAGLLEDEDLSVLLAP